MKQLLHKIARYFLPVLFISYIGCISLFTHSHVVNGVTIVHSHPFGKMNGGPCHHHASLSEIQLFHILTTLSVEDGAVHALHLNFNAQQIAEIVEHPVYPDYKLPDKGLLCLRAPPVF